MNKSYSIMELLPAGEENAISWEALVNLLDLSSKRELQRIIERERKDGKVILSSKHGGYFAPGTTAEIIEFIRINEAKARSTFAALKSARKALEKLHPGA